MRFSNNKTEKNKKSIYKGIIWRSTYAILMTILSLELMFFSTYMDTSLAKNSSSKIIDTDGDGYLDNVDPNVYEWDVGMRDLAIFASLAYEDVSDNMIRTSKYRNITKNDLGYQQYLQCMYKSETDGKYCFVNSKLKGFDGIKITDKLSLYKENGPEYIFYNFADASEVSKWDIVDHKTQASVSFSNESGMFTATTFKNGNNIVIAFRGTDFDDILEWMQDILGYGFIGYHGQEEFAQEYVTRIADIYSDSKYKIYITGHSLGGYLAQIGAAQLIQDNKAQNLEQVVYFNGMGLKFNQLLPSKIQDKAQVALKSWANGDNLISYSTGGDPVSALGTHYGKTIVLPASPIAIQHHKGQMENLQLNLIGVDLTSTSHSRRLSNLLKLIEKTTFIKNDTNISKYYKQYGFTSLLDFMWTAHETDSFLYNLDQGTRSWKNYIKQDEAPTCTMKLSSSTVKLRKNITLTIECIEDNKLVDKTINKNNIKVETAINRIRVEKISGPTETKLSNGDTKYTWKVTLKGILTGDTKVSLLKDSLKDEAGNGNAKIISSNIKVTLR